MIENFASFRDRARSEFLDLNHTSNFIILVSLMIPKLPHEASIELRRASESGH